MPATHSSGNSNGSQKYESEDQERALTETDGQRGLSEEKTFKQMLGQNHGANHANVLHKELASAAAAFPKRTLVTVR